MLSASTRTKQYKKVVSPEIHGEEELLIDETRLVDHSEGNRLVDWSSLKSTIEGNAVCRTCHSPLTLTEETVGIATSVHLCCTTCKMKKKTVN